MWKASKYRVISDPYSVRMQENTDQKTSYLDTYHAVIGATGFLYAPLKY